MSRPRLLGHLVIGAKSRFVHSDSIAPPAEV